MTGDSGRTVDEAAVLRLPYRRGVGIMLLDPSSRVFVGQRIDSPQEAWQMPQGGIDEGETPLEAAWREMEEEIGTRAAALIGETEGWLRYDLPLELVPRVWGGRFRGQEQKWFAFRFTGSDADIDIAAREPEFLAWKWAELDELAQLIVPFKRQIYEAVIRELAPLARR